MRRERVIAGQAAVFLARRTRKVLLLLEAIESATGSIGLATYP